MDAQKRDLCRLCLEPINGCDEILLNNDYNLIKSILLITGVEVVSDPGQCEFLCSQCQCLLEQCVEFREKCISNDGAFRKIMLGANHVGDCKPELEIPPVQYIKQEPVELEEPADDVNAALVNDQLSLHEVAERFVEKQMLSKEVYDDGTELGKLKHDTRMVQCQQCGSLVPHNELKEHHEIYCSNRRNFCCPYCPIEFPYIEDQQEHINTCHTHGMQYICNQCGKAYATRRSFLVHYRSVHICDKMFMCTICGERFDTASSRVQHFRMVHSADRTFACEYCDNTFLNKRCLLRHTKYHCATKRALEGQEKPGKNNRNVTKSPKAKKKYPGVIVQCQQCGKSMQRHRLSEHQEIHETERKRLNCPHCPKKYLYIKDLREHVHAVHTQGVQYACNECGKSYTTRRSFIDHQSAMHSGEKRYACTVCGDKFGAPWMRSYHQRTAHQLHRPYGCDTCNKTFKTMSHLTAHIRQHHQEPSEDESFSTVGFL